MRKITYAFLGVFVGTVLALVMAELILSQIPELIDNPPGQYRRSATRAYEHVPHFSGRDRFRNPIHINSFGLRDREYPKEKPEGVYRILVLGDSVAFGDGVRAEHTFAKQLEHRLNENARSKVEVLNAGVRGYNTAQELILLEEIGFSLHPDAVILCYTPNDAEPLSNQTGRIDAKHEWLIRLKDGIKQRSYLYSFLRNRVEVVFKQASPKKFMASYARYFAPEHEGWRNSVAALKKMKDGCRERNIDLVLAVYPLLKDFDGQSVPDQVLKTAQALPVDALDLRECLNVESIQKLRVTPQDAFHPNAQGHRLIAEALAKYFKAKGLLP